MKKSAFTRKTKLIWILVILLALCSCSKTQGPADTGNKDIADNTDEIAAINEGWGFTPTEFADPIISRVAGNAEDYFFFDGLELGTKYTDMGSAINKDGIFGHMKDDRWDEELDGSLSIFSSAITSDKDFVDTTLDFSREDYFDDFKLWEVEVVLKMDATQPEMDEFVSKKDDLLKKFIKDNDLPEIQKIPEGEIPDECDSYRDGYLSEGYTSELFEGYVYDDEETRTKYYFVAAYYTKDDPDETRGESGIIADLIFRKTLYPKTYSLESE